MLAAVIVVAALLTSLMEQTNRWGDVADERAVMMFSTAMLTAHAAGRRPHKGSVFS
ncbi:MAG: hypothetical protein ACLVB5_06505 [Christensenellales bacterium]